MAHHTLKYILPLVFLFSLSWGDSSSSCEPEQPCPLGPLECEKTRYSPDAGVVILGLPSNYTVEDQYFSNMYSQILFADKIGQAFFKASHGGCMMLVLTSNCFGTRTTGGCSYAEWTDNVYDELDVTIAEDDICTPDWYEAFNEAAGWLEDKKRDHGGWDVNYEIWAVGDGIAEEPYIEDYDAEVRVWAAVERIKINVVQVGELFIDDWDWELSTLATAPKSENFLKVSSYDDLTDAAALFGSRILGANTQECDVFNGAHISTFDGVNYDIQEYGSHILASSPDDSFSVIQRRYPGGAAEYLITDVDNRIELYFNPGAEIDILLNGERDDRETWYSYWTANDFEGEIDVLSIDSYYNLSAVQVWTSDEHTVTIIYTPSFQQVKITPNLNMFGHWTHWRGLCGNFDGCPKNDFELSNGDYLLPSSTAAQLKAMSTSWTANPNLYKFSILNKGMFVTNSYPSAGPTSAAVSDCSIVPSAWLKQSCESDITNFGASSIVARVYQDVAKEACDSLAIAGVMLSNVITPAECEGLCFTNRPTFNLHENYTVENVLVDFIDDNFDHASFRSYLGGSYTINARTNLCQHYSTNFTINLRCPGNLYVNAGADRTIHYGSTGFPTVQFAASVSGAVSPQISWDLVQWPDHLYEYKPTTALEVGCSILEPWFQPQYPGLYVFEMAAYDGCQIVKDRVSLNVLCEKCEKNIEVHGPESVTWENVDAEWGFPDSWQEIYAEFPYSEVLPFEDYDDDDYNWEFIMDWANTSSEYYYATSSGEEYLIYRVTNETVLNVTRYISDSYVQVQDETYGTEDPETDFRWSSTATNFWSRQYQQNITKYTIEKLAYPQEEILVCSILLDNEGSRVRYKIRDYTFKRLCARDYTVRLTIVDDCGPQTKDFTITAQCQKPIAIFNGIPKQHFVAYSGFQTINLGAYSADSVDTVSDSSELDYHYEVLSSPTGSTAAISGSQFKPDLPGQYTLRVTVDTGCMNDTDTVTFTADCGNITTQAALTVNSVQWINDTYSGVAPNFNLDASGSTGIENYISMTYHWSATLNGVALDTSGFTWFTSSSYNPSFTPHGAGLYIITVNVTDGCTFSTASVTVVWTCDSVLTLPTPTSPVTLTWDPLGQTFGGQLIDLTSFSIDSLKYGNQNDWASFSYHYGSWTGSEWPPQYTFTPSEAGTTVVEATLSDGCHSTSRSVTINAVCGQTVTAAIRTNYINNQYPVEDIPDALTSGVTILLNASFSTNAVKYTYQVTNLETGDTILNTPTTSPSMSFIAVNANSYSVTLTATDGCSSSSQTITVAPVCTHPVTLTPSGTTFSSAFADGKFGKVFWDITATADVDPTTIMYPTWVYTIVTAPENSIYWSYQEFSNVTVYLQESGSTGSTNNPDGTTTFHSYEIYMTDYEHYYRAAVLNSGPKELYDFSNNWAPDVAGTFVIELTVENACGTEFKKSITINAACNAAPVISIVGGVNQTFQFNSTQTDRVSLDASLSSDADEDALAYKWTIVGSPHVFPQIPNATLSEEHIESALNWRYELMGRHTPVASFFPETAGVYTLLLEVTDGCTVSSTLVTYRITCGNLNPNWLIDINQESTTHTVIPLTALPCGEYDWELVAYTPVPAPPPIQPNNQENVEANSQSENNLTHADVVGLAVGIPLGILLLAAIIIIIIGVIIFMRKKGSPAALPEVTPS